ncbi:C40 family peptidase [Actinomadura rupiterrae]|uniref:C40 family peptidase n=1 Tax=Actinomadura rupiterrae TaxID=559627 RepID=UPI0020A48F63|nr:NlpC/P60 family protein [Actinomadura rupiterrae]MCP2342005.1 cell wall-associated NlpC family hydrolase [Actinomadura rupiterrae]
MPLLLTAGAGLLGLVLVAMLGALGVTLGTADNGGAQGCQGLPGRAAASIPATYLALYIKAGAKYGVPWSVLAAVGKAESDHGRGPGSGIRSGTNAVGAAGPMQFLPSTWNSFGVDGDADGTRDVYNPADAIFSAANYLRHNGAPERMRQALFAYNHDQNYVTGILAQAAAYAQDADPSACAAGPLGPVSGRAGVAVRAALRWLGTPYSWGGGGPGGPSRGSGRGAGTVGFDCSSLMLYAWHQAGLALPRTSQEQWTALPHVPPGREQPGDLAFFAGAGGTQQAPGHVGMVIGGGRMVEAPHTGEHVRVSSYQARSDLVGFGRPKPQR